MSNTFTAGAGQANITPRDSQFLFGYPHVSRYSTGVHDPLFSSALLLSNGDTEVMFIANDIIFVSKALVQNVRSAIAAQTGIPPKNIMISATHTHSGPITVDYISNLSDKIIPKTDRAYLALLEEKMVQAALEAYNKRCPAEVAFAIADATGIGTNRHDPTGPADLNTPIMIVRNQQDKKVMACMLTCSMHPTVLHEDSTLISADFPGGAREVLQQQVFNPECVVLHHTAPAGNQSPRHVTKANTFAEAQRLGQILGRAVQHAATDLEFMHDVSLNVLQEQTDLPRRTFPTVAQAQVKLDQAVKQLQQLRDDNAPSQEIRTAECDWFGAEETLTLARAAAEGLDETYQSCLPAEIQIIKVASWHFVAWPGECFVEYALAVKNAYPNTAVISLANGELQGYITTEEAAQQGHYEASNALFSPQSGTLLIRKTLEMLNSFSDK
ncbi:MAG: neutral/alkaline non-lysosomal ceramidase N-terminal domain-containing protein [Sedimentisphaerales bacterium]|nr:neutral/alkaline non-lysosomal ceramidase N-terminal domain-containing protein [Sedimentisphaerales bacterium]